MVYFIIFLILVQPKGGHWIGCVAVDTTGDWLVCGGSMSPTIYHLSTLSKVASLQVPSDVVTQTAIFVKDRVCYLK